MYTAAQIADRVDPAHGCALGGIIAFCNSIEGALPIVHGPTGCAGGYRLVTLLCDREPLMPVTAVYQYELVMGTGKKLEAALYKAKRIYRPTIIFAMLTCATSMSGEDYTSIIERFERETDTKVFLLDGSGLFGEDIDGYIESYRRFIEWMNFKRDPMEGIVAIDGISPANYGAKQMFKQFAEIVTDECGLTLAPSVSISFDPARDLAAYSRASVIYAGYLWTFAEERVLAPIGIEATYDLIKHACRAAGRPVPQEAYERMAAHRERFAAGSAALRERLCGRYAMVEADGFFAVPLARLLKNEFDMQVAVSTDAEGFAMLQEEHTCDWLRADMGGYELDRMCDALDCAVAFGSSNVNSHDDEKRLYIPYTSPCWDEVPELKTYFGYTGAFSLLETLRKRFL